MKEELRNLLRTLTTLGRPAARMWARRGYFRETPPESPRSVAVVACHWIGDTFWAMQVVPALREKWPGCRIVAITKPATVDLWNGLLPAADVVAVPEITSDRHREETDAVGLIDRAWRLSDERFDAAIDLTGNRYSALFTFVMRPGWSIGFDGGELGWLYSRNVGDADAAAGHLSERPFRVIEPVVGKFEPPHRLRVPEPVKGFGDVCREIGLDAARPVVVIAPGAGWAAKRWPKESFAETARLVAASGMQVAVVGSKGERVLCEEVVSSALSAAASPGGAGQTASAAPIVVLSGERLGIVCGLLSGSAAVIGNDSGLVHLAAAYGRRTVVIFTGETDPARVRPIGDHVTLLDATDIAVAPPSVAAAVG